MGSAPPTPLLKPGNGIRPIIVGMIWPHLVFNMAIEGVSKDMIQYLQDFQLSVGVPGGAEAVLLN